MMSSWCSWILKALFCDSECVDNISSTDIAFMDALCDQFKYKEDVFGIVIIDGICNLCNAFINFVSRFDDDNKIHIGCAQNEEVVIPLLGIVNITPLSILTKFAFIEYNQKAKQVIVYRASTASFNIIKHLSFPVNVLYVFIFVPIFVRNSVYGIVAEFRYQLFGQTEDGPELSEMAKKRLIHTI